MIPLKISLLKKNTKLVLPYFFKRKKKSLIKVKYRLFLKKKVKFFWNKSRQILTIFYLIEFLKKQQNNKYKECLQNNKSHSLSLFLVAPLYECFRFLIIFLNFLYSQSINLSKFDPISKVTFQLWDFSFFIPSELGTILNFKLTNLAGKEVVFFTPYFCLGFFLSYLIFIYLKKRDNIYYTEEIKPILKNKFETKKFQITLNNIKSYGAFFIFNRFILQRFIVKMTFPTFLEQEANKKNFTNFCDIYSKKFNTHLYIYINVIRPFLLNLGNFLQNAFFISLLFNFLQFFAYQELIFYIIKFIFFPLKLLVFIFNLSVLIPIMNFLIKFITLIIIILFNGLVLIFAYYLLSLYKEILKTEGKNFLLYDEILGVKTIDHHYRCLVPTQYQRCCDIENRNLSCFYEINFNQK